MSVQIAERWFETRRIDDAITLLWEPHVIPLMRCNIWHVRGRERDLLIDTGMGIASLRDAARHLLEKPVIAVATHTHADHVGGHFEFDDCLVHSIEADRLSDPTGRGTMLGSPGIRGAAWEGQGHFGGRRPVSHGRAVPRRRSARLLVGSRWRPPRLAGRLARGRARRLPRIAPRQLPPGAVLQPHP